MGRDFYPNHSDSFKVGNPVEHGRFNRRELLTLAVFGAGVAAAARFVDSARMYTRELTKDQREYLLKVGQERLEWSNASNPHGEGARFVALLDSGETISIARERGRNNYFYEVQVSHGQSDFLYRCPCYMVNKDDKKVIETLLAVANGEKM